MVASEKSAQDLGPQNYAYSLDGNIVTVRFDVSKVLYIKEDDKGKPKSEIVTTTAGVITLPGGTRFNMSAWRPLQKSGKRPPVAHIPVDGTA